MSTSDMQSRSSRPCGFESGYHFHGVNKRVVVKRNADVNPQKTSNMARAFCRLATFPAISKAFPTIEPGGFNIQRPVPVYPPVLPAGWWRLLIQRYNGKLDAFQIGPEYSSHSPLLPTKRA
jgi:hypothetical protein